MGDTIWSREKPQKFISDPVVVVTPSQRQMSLGGVSRQAGLKPLLGVAAAGLGVFVQWEPLTARLRLPLGRIGS